MGTAEGMRAYSMDLRERVVAAVDRGMTQEQAAVTFGVSVNTVGRYLTRRRNTGSLAPTAYRHGPRPEKTQRLQVAAEATVTEHAAAFTAEEGLVVSLATMSRAITTLPADDPPRRGPRRGVGGGYLTPKPPENRCQPAAARSGGAVSRASASRAARTSAVNGAVAAGGRRRRRPLRAGRAGGENSRRRRRLGSPRGASCAARAGGRS